MLGAQKKKLMILILAFSGALLAEGAFAYYCISERGALYETLEVLDREEKEAQLKIQQIPTLSTKRQELATIIGEYAQILPREEEIRFDAFLEDIDAFTRDAQLEILTAEPERIKKKKVKPKKGKKKVAMSQKDTFVRHAYRFKLEGSYIGLLKFINKIENHPRFLRIDEIHVKPRRVKGEKKDIAGEAEDPLKTIELVISTYTYSQDSRDEEAK